MNQSSLLCFAIVSSPVSTQCITSILDSLEEAWADGRAPKIIDYLDKLMKFDDLEACLGACAADLEWRWKTFFQTGNLSECHRARTYLQRFPSLFALASYYDMLLHSEWLARSRWGDAPAVDEFISDFEFPSKGETNNVNTKSIRFAFVRSLDEIAPLVTSVVCRTKEIRFVCPPEYEIGRRRKSDPPPIAWVESLNRLVVTDEDELTVSRRQLIVKRIRLHEVELTNVSKNVTISIGEEKLAPGQRARIETPFSIQLKEVQIHFKTD